MSVKSNTSKKAELTTEEIAEIRKKADDYFYQNDYLQSIKYYELHTKYDKKCSTSYEMLGWLYYFIDIEKSVKNYIKAFNLSYQINYIDYDSFGNFMLALTRHPNYTQSQLKNLIENFVKKVKRKTLTSKEVFKHPKTTQLHRKLNIGYLSSDLYTHAAMQFILPILKNHNTNVFNIFFYYAGTYNDNLTQFLMQKPYIFKNVNEKSFKEIAQTIYDDKIDILIDLSSLTHKYALTMLYKPAPVQMSYMGFLNTTGMKEVDYIIADKDTIPEEQNDEYTENILYLPRYECFEFTNNISSYIKETPLPYKRNGFITFGSFNCTSKINKNVLRCWSEIIKRNPRARLYIYRSNMTNQVIEQITKVLKKFKTDMSRVIIDNTDYGFHFDIYKDVDIALDTFPFTGLTITVELAHIGVPVITKVCDTFSSKGGMRINKALGCEELITYSDEEYINAATELANDIPRLEKYRKNLRNNLENSLLYNNKLFTKYFETGLIKAINKYYGLE